MKTNLILFVLLFTSTSFSDEAIISFAKYKNTCSRVLKQVRPIRESEISRSFLVFNLLNDIPSSTLSRDFFGDDSDPEQLYVFEGYQNPTFGKTGVERWKRLGDVQLNLRENIFFMRRELTEDGLYRFTEQTRFKLDEEEAAFVEIFDFFKTVTRTHGRGSGADYMELFSANDSKLRMRAMLSGWALSVGDNRKIDDFVYEANQIIGDPAFVTNDPRVVRAYFNKVVEAFKDHFGLMSGFSHKYDTMLDNLERRGLLRYYLLI